MPLILPARTLDSSYEIDNSLRFSDSNYLTRDNTTQSGGGTNFTFSAWLKMTSYDVGGYQGILSIFKDSNDFFEIYKDNSENLQIQQQINGTSVYYQSQDFKYRDYSAWYHLVVNFNNSESSEVNKVSVYVNGIELTGTVNNSNPFDDVGLGDSAYDTRIGAYRDNTSATWNGYMADVYLIAGQTLAASEFGETNDNGVWIPKAYSGSYGDNGFFLEWQNSGSLGTDTSGNGNNLTVTGLSSTDQTTDTPTNNFATFNPLHKASNVTLSEGNCKASIAGAGQSRSVTSTIAVSKGKWYWENKYTTDVVSCFYGLVSADIGWNINATEYPSSSVSDNVGFNDGGTKYVNGTSSSYHSGGAGTVSNNDIVGCAANLDDNEVTFYVNGTALNSGTPISKTFSGDYFFVVQHQSSGGTSNFETNFGNPTFSISSGNSDANGYGNFEYAVPSGYYALCTKNLAEYG